MVCDHFLLPFFETMTTQRNKEALRKIVEFKVTSSFFRFQYCRNNGGRLVRIHNQRDHEQAVAYIATINNQNMWYWIGLNDRRRLDHWQWEDDNYDRMTVSYWQLNEPSHTYEGGDEDCVHYYYGKSKYVWNDLDCNKQDEWYVIDNSKYALHALCEKL